MPNTGAGTERIRQLERRADTLEKQVDKLLDRTSRNGERLEGAGRTLSRIESKIDGEVAARQASEKEQRTTSLGERTVLIGAGGVIIAAIITAVSQLAGHL